MAQGGILRSTFVFWAGLAAASAAQELTLDQVLQKNEEALGGAATVSSIKTMKMTARMVVNPSMDAEMAYFVKRPNQLRTEVEIQGKRIITGYDGQTAWMMNPLTGSPDAQKVDEQAAGVPGNSTMDYLIGSLSGMRASGSAVELAGEDEVDGSTAYKLKVSGKAGLSATYYLSTATFLPIKIVARVRQMGQDLEMETYPAEYKKVGGIMLAHRTENKVGGKSMLEMRIESVEFNASLEDSLFQMPQPSEKPKQ